MKKLLIILLLFSAKCFSQDPATWQVIGTDTAQGIIITYTKAMVQVNRVATAIYGKAQRGVDGYWYDESSGMPAQHRGKENDYFLIKMLIVGGPDFDPTKYYQFIRKTQLY